MNSTRDYDWLGEGSYFWENDLVRGHQWASEPQRKYQNPTVVGAVIELGHCLDLTTQTGIDAVKRAYDQFKKLNESAGRPLPENKAPQNQPDGDRLIRCLDCAVMNHVFHVVKTAQESDPTILSYETVRSLFPEGERLYTDAGFLKKTHIQICVREPKQILGVFRIPEWQRIEYKLPELY